MQEYNIQVWKNKWCGRRMNLDYRTINAKDETDALEKAHRVRRQWADRVWSDEKGPYAKVFQAGRLIAKLDPRSDDRVPRKER